MLHMNVLFIISGLATPPLLIVPNVTQYYQNPVITCDWDINTDDKTVKLFLNEELSASYNVSSSGELVDREESDYISYKESAEGWLSVIIKDVTEKTKGPYSCRISVQMLDASTRDWFSNSATLLLASKFFVYTLPIHVF